MLRCCTLCPRECKVDRTKGEEGFCGCDDKIKIARSALHFWEEPCISGSEGSGTVFFSGCNMKCVFCQNFSISTKNRGKIVSKEELAEEFLRLENEGANNINLVTPTHYVLQIKEALEISKKRGLSVPIVYNSSGYEKIETLKMMSGLIDIYMPDFKYYKDEYAIKYSSAPDYFKITSRAISEMFSQVGVPVFDKRGIMKKGVIVRHLMLPGLLFDSKKVLDYLYKTYKDDIFISIMSQYTPMPNVKDDDRLSKKLSRAHYEAMVSYCAEMGIKNAFVQEDGCASESFIPDFE